MKSGEPEAAVSANRNLISFETELTGKECFYGQGAGKYPTAYNAVSDCIDILSGVKSFYTDGFVPAHSDNSLEEHPYYVRFAGCDEWLEHSLPVSSVSKEMRLRFAAALPAATSGWRRSPKEAAARAL